MKLKLKKEKLKVLTEDEATNVAGGGSNTQACKQPTGTCPSISCSGCCPPATWPDC